MTEARKERADREGFPRALRAVVFELEYVAVNGRQVMYDTLKRLLHQKDIDLTPVMFSRYVLDAPVAAYVPVLLKQAGRLESPRRSWRLRSPRAPTRR